VAEPIRRAPGLSVKEGNLCNPAREFTANATAAYSKMLSVKTELPLPLQAGLKELTLFRKVLDSNLSWDTG
jgi:hypothetical protein